jgi:hypothetical protein
VWIAQLLNSAIYHNVSGGGSITTHNFPLPWTGRQDIVLSGVLSFFIALGIVIGFAFVAAFYASFLVYERENNVKHQQVCGRGSAADVVLHGVSFRWLSLRPVDFRCQHQRVLDINAALGHGFVSAAHVYAVSSRLCACFVILVKVVRDITLQGSPSSF